MRIRHLLAILLLLAVVLAPGDPADAANPASDEATFVAMINNLRTSKGLNALAVDAQLTGQARRWAGVMAADGVLKHAGDLSVGISANWDVLGENVGVHGAPNLNQLFQAFVASPAHYANLVDPRYEYVGVGVVYDNAGTIWTTHRFMGVRDATPAPTTTAPPTTQPPTTQPPTTQPPTTRAPATAPPPTTVRPSTTRPPTTRRPSANRPAATLESSDRRSTATEAELQGARADRATATASGEAGSGVAAATASASASARGEKATATASARAGTGSATATGSASASSGPVADSATDRSTPDQAHEQARSASAAAGEAGGGMVAGPSASPTRPLAGGILDGRAGTIRGVTADKWHPLSSAQFVRAALTPAPGPTSADDGRALDLPLLSAVLSDVDQAGL